MKNTHPTWQSYLAATTLTLVVLAGVFYGKVLIGSMEAGLFLGSWQMGAALGFLVSGVLLLLAKKPEMLAGVCGFCLAGWLCIGGHDQAVSALLGCGCAGCLAMIPWCARLLSRAEARP